jgi:hypothetical protein
VIFAGVWWLGKKSDVEEIEQVSDDGAGAEVA